MEIMLRMTKPLWITGEMVIMENSFCVLKGWIGMHKRGFYVNALVKKRRYWPSVH